MVKSGQIDPKGGQMRFRSGLFDPKIDQVLYIGIFLKVVYWPTKVVYLILKVVKYDHQLTYNFR